MTATLVVLILLMIAGAIVAVETPNLLHSVISVGAVGFLLSIVFLFLSAPDLAITQIAVEVITLVILLRATRPDSGDQSRDGAQRDEEAFRGGVIARRVVAVVALLALAGFSMRMFADFPEFGQPVIDRFGDAPSNNYLRSGLEQTGAANIVTAILLDYRGYDTLGEATVLFCAVLGALSILRRHMKKGPAETGGEGEP